MPPNQIGLKRTIGFFSCAALVGVALALFGVAAAGRYVVYPLGNWPAPFGIVLVLDRLAAGMLLLTALIALAAYLYALRGWDERGPHFGALFQFQLMGVNGAFLTGDIFNLFVFFEVLLIASYGLLLHGGGRERLRAGIQYVVLNLAGSALFLIGLGLLYSVTGSLNLADLQLRYAAVSTGDRALAEAASLLLLVVFCLKAAAFPLTFWLPTAYGAAGAPVAAFFAIMTKVGVYAILRVHLSTFGGAEPATDAWAELLLPAALVTIALGTLGALAARSLRGLVSYLTVVSVGTLLVTVAIATSGSIAAGLYYLVHSTFVTAALFLLVEFIGEQRAERYDALEPGPEVAQPTLLGVLFLIAAMAVAGLPPLLRLSRQGERVAGSGAGTCGGLDLGRHSRWQCARTHRARAGGQPAFLEDCAAPVAALRPAPLPARLRGRDPAAPRSSGSPRSPSSRGRRRPPRPIRSRTRPGIATPSWARTTPAMPCGRSAFQLQGGGR